MTVNITQLQFVAPQQLGVADLAPFYTVPTLTTARIGRAVFTNTSASAVTITAGISTGGALTVSNIMISSFPLTAGQAYIAAEFAGAVLPAGSQIRALSNTFQAVTFTASGIISQ